MRRNMNAAECGGIPGRNRQKRGTTIMSVLVYCCLCSFPWRDIMVAAPAAQHSISTPVDYHPWNMHQKCETPAQTMKLLAPQNVQALLLRTLSARPSSPSSGRAQSKLNANGNGDLPSGSLPTGDAVTSGVDGPDVKQLLELSTEELMRHTLKVQLERISGSRGSPKSGTSQLKALDQTPIISHTGYQNPSKRHSKCRRKRRRASRSVSPPVDTRVISTRNSTSTPAREAASLKARPLRMGLSVSDVQRLDAALRSANQEVRMLRVHLKTALGKTSGLLSIDAARSATSLVLNKGSTMGDFNSETALRLISSLPSSVRVDNHGDAILKPGNGVVDIDGIGSPVARGGAGAGGETSTGEPGDAITLPEERDADDVGKQQLANAGPNYHQRRCDGENAVSCERLVARLAAEMRISAMADHLGSEERIDVSWLKSVPVQSRSVVAAKSPAIASVDAALSTDGPFTTLPRLNGRGPALSEGVERRAHSADALSLSVKQTPTWDDPGGLGAAGGPAAKKGYRSRKRSRGADEKVDGRGISRSHSFAMGQRHQTVPEDGDMMDACPALPRLKISRLSGGLGSRDAFDRFGGRETPNVLRRGFLTGGGEETKEVIEELRRQLDITQRGLLDLNSLVRADVAWVQETVGARLSRRAKVSCCKWGSEKIGELTRRWEGRFLREAMTTWKKHREYMVNKDLVRAFLKRKGAAKTRRLLEVWCLRLPSRALEEWRRRVRLQRRADEAAAASAVQRIGRGFLGRRKFQRTLEFRSAVQLQKMTRGMASRLRVARTRGLVHRHEAAGKIQDQARKRGERRRAQRIVALKKRRRAAIKIQKTARGYFGRGRYSRIKEEQLQNQASTAVQAAWRGLQGKRKVDLARNEAETMRATQKAAAISIQTAQRKRAAQASTDQKRRIKALQRRRSAEIAAVDIQRVARGRMGRVSAADAATRQEERQKDAAAIHIQRAARGREARRRALAITIARDAPPIPLPPVVSAAGSPKRADDRSTAEQTYVLPEMGSATAEVTSARAPFDGLNAFSLPEKAERQTTEGLQSLELGVFAATGGDEQCRQDSSRSSELSGGLLSEQNTAAETAAATRIQAVGRGRTARAEARRRKQKRLAEEKRRANVWGQGGTVGGDDRTRTHEGEPSAGASAPSATSRAGRGKKQSEEAAAMIQAVFRGGLARSHTKERLAERQKLETKAKSRAKAKREREAVVKIQTQARGMAAKDRRARQRARHTARVGSIRDSGRAAADDLRALSRPGTAAEATAVGGAVTLLASGSFAALDSGGRGGFDDSKPLAAGGVADVLEMAATTLLGASSSVAALRTSKPPPSSPSGRKRASPRYQTTQLSPGSAAHSAGRRSPLSGSKTTMPPASQSDDYAIRPSSATRSAQASEGSGNRSVGKGAGSGAEWSEDDVKRIQRDMRRGIEEELHRELTAKLSEELEARLDAKEAEREGVLKEAEEARRQDREAVQEAMKSVLEAHSKDAEEIELMKAKLKEEEEARRAEHDASLQEYERRLAEVRAEALAEAEKSRLAAEAVEALRRQMVERDAEEKINSEQAGDRRAVEETLTLERGAREHAARNEELRATKLAEEQKKEDEERQKLHQQNAVMQQLAVEAAERQRAALVQLQVQLREEEAKRSESHSAWEARQAEEDAQAKEERRAELEALETLKRQMGEDKMRAHQELELRNAEVRLQMESLRVLQEKAEEQERIRLEGEKLARQEERARLDGVIQAGARLMQDDDLEDNEDDDHTRVEAGSSRPTTSTDVEEAVKREIEAVTSSRLAQVDITLQALSKKQEELERKGEELEEARREMGTATPSTSAAAGVSAAQKCSTPTVDTANANSTPLADESREALAGAVTPRGAAVEWVEYWDESAGASYYFNTITQEASWTDPLEEAAGGGSVVEAGAAAEQEANTVSQPEDGHAKWTECLDESSGATYYYNVVTGEARWDKPAELEPKGETVGGTPQFDNPEEWVCFLDETSGEEYWFNLTTGETHWGAAPP